MAVATKISSVSAQVDVPDEQESGPVVVDDGAQVHEGRDGDSQDGSADDDTQADEGDNDEGSGDEGSGDDGDGEGFRPITTQAQFDRMIQKRIERARKKAIPADYDDLRAKAARLDEIEARLNDMEKERDLVNARIEVSKKTGVPIDVLGVLAGSSREEIERQAELIRTHMPVYPTVNEAPGASVVMSKADIARIKNPSERRAAIRANLGLYG